MGKRLLESIDWENHRMKTSDLLEWVADRLVYVYKESPNVDFVLTLREHAKMVKVQETKWMGEKKRIITKNSVQCLTCMDIIVSRHRWDFVRCSCGAIAVDGGTDYLRRLGDGPFLDLSEFAD